MTTIARTSEEEIPTMTTTELTLPQAGDVTNTSPAGAPSTNSPHSYAANGSSSQPYGPTR